MAKSKEDRAKWYRGWAKKNQDKIKEYQRRYRAKRKAAKLDKELHG